MELKDTPPEPQKLRMFRSRSSDSPVERISVWQRRPHQIKQSDRHKIVYAIGHEPAAFRSAEVKKPRRNCSHPGGESDKQCATSSKQTNPCHKKYLLFAHTELRRQTSQPPESRNEMGLQRQQRFRQPACRSGKQVSPIVSKREAVERYLQPEATTQHPHPRICTWPK